MRYQAEDMLQENFSLEVENLHHAMSKDEYKQKLAQAKAANQLKVVAPQKPIKSYLRVDRMMSVIFEGELESENSSFFGPASSRPQEMTIEAIERSTVDLLYLQS